MTPTVLTLWAYLALDIAVLLGSVYQQKWPYAVIGLGFAITTAGLLWEATL